MWHSLQPASLARLLLRLVEDQRRARSRWEVDHLWFERDVEARGAAPGWGVVGMVLPDGDTFSLRVHGGASPKRALLERAGVAIDQAGGDRELRQRLDRAATRRARR